MNPRRLATILLVPFMSVLLALVAADPAWAVTLQQKIAVLTSWTQPTSTSYNAWNAARQNQGAWTAYRFDWSTDYCSDSPDQPLGFDFRLPCWHHDFGYRNFKTVGTFDANKSRIDDTFYFDLRTKCGTYNIFVRSACYSLAWTYYQAVKTFGNLAVSPTDLASASKQRTAGLAAQAAAERAAKLDAAANAH
jgi:hypothetical protein